MNQYDSLPRHHTNRTGMLVSIVTPTFNSARYLRETLASVASQTYQWVEHIVVDGGSTDDSLKIANEFPQLRVLSGKDNGMYDAVNKGLRAASGSILAYLNSDDLYFPDTVERAMRVFDSSPTTGMVFGNCRYVDDDANVLFTRRYPPFNWTLYAVLDGSTIPQQCCFWRRTLLEQAGYFDPSFLMAGDFEFFVRAGKLTKVVRIPGPPLAQFRFHAAMQTLKRRSLNDSEVKRIHAMYPIAPAWALGTVRAWATVRYKARNTHRIWDKLKHFFVGSTARYRP